MLNLSEKMQTIILTIIYLTIPISLLYLTNISLEQTWTNEHILFSLIATIIALIGTVLKGLNRPIHQQNLFSSAIATIGIWILVLMISITIMFFINETQNLSRKTILLWVVLTPLSIIITRLILSKTIKRKPVYTLVLGEKYKFTEHEINCLKKQKHHLIKIDDQQNIKKINEQIEKNISKNKSISIILNISTQNDELTKLLIQKEQQGISLINLEFFMENVLRKFYIPLDNWNCNTIPTQRLNICR